MKLENIKTMPEEPIANQPYTQVEAGLRTFKGQNRAQKNPFKSPSGVRLEERSQHLAVTYLGAHGPERQLAPLKNARTSQYIF